MTAGRTPLVSGAVAAGLTMTALRHCVLGAFTKVATEAQKRQMYEALEGLKQKIPEIVGLAVGPDLGLAHGNHDFALNVEFACEEDYLVYASHPEHVAVKEVYIKPILRNGSRTAVQFALSRNEFTAAARCIHGAQPAGVRTAPTEAFDIAATAGAMALLVLLFLAAGAALALCQRRQSSRFRSSRLDEHEVVDVARPASPSATPEGVAG